MTQYRYERLQPEYAALWAGMRVIKIGPAQAQAREVIAAKPRYQAVERATGVPWFVVGCLHMRESGGDFGTWLHNGDPMRDRQGRPVRTVHVPAGRPADPSVSWEDGAYDALVTVEHLDQIDRWCPERVAYAAELFNGFGYRHPARNIPSPYLWGGTSVQRPGKFVRDGVYDRTVMDPQIGAMAVLRQIMDMDPDARFDDAPASLMADPELEAPPLSPRADDTECEVKPLTKSRTIWGGVVSYAGTVATAIASFFDHLENPYTLAAFVALLAVASIGLWLVLSGRLNVQNVVAHLSEDA